MFSWQKFFIIIAVMSFSVISSAVVCYHVSPDGTDTASGTVEAPFLTLGRAQEAIREHLRTHPHDSVKVLLRDGRHYLPQPLILTAADSGTAYSPVSYEAFPGETPVLVGGRPLQLKWKSYNQTILAASVPEAAVVDQPSL